MHSFFFAETCVFFLPTSRSDCATHNFKNEKIFSWIFFIVKADGWLKHLQSFKTQHVKTNFSMSDLLLKTWVFFERNTCITARAFLCCAILLCEHEKLLALADLYCKCYAVCICTSTSQQCNRFRYSPYTLHSIWHFPFKTSSTFSTNKLIPYRLA